MGSNHSTQKSTNIENVRKMLEKSDNSTDEQNVSDTLKSNDFIFTEGGASNNNVSDTLGSLNFSEEEHENGNKEEEHENGNKEEEHENKKKDETEDSQVGGHNLKKKSHRNRYSKYNVYSTINKAEKDFLGGFNSELKKEETEEGNTMSEQVNNKEINHIRNIIMKELDNLNKQSLNQIGAGCDCEKEEKKEEEENHQNGGSIILLDNSSSSSNSSDSSDSSDSDTISHKKKHAKNNQSRSKKSKKSKKSRKKNKLRRQKDEKETGDSEDSDDDEFEGNITIKSEEELETSNSEEGLSIFPFNSSDVKSSVSDRHQKLLRRKL
jgi:hypothetical protein